MARHKRGTVIRPSKKGGTKPLRSTRHHIIPRSRGGKSDSSNTIMIDDRLHMALHDVFGNLRPDEYLDYMSCNLIKVCVKIIKAIAKHVGDEVFNLDK